MVDEGQRDVSERRVFPRVSFSGPVEFQTRGPALPGGCLPRDISQGGIRVNLNTFVPLNAELDLQIHLGLEKVAPCSGRVVWIRKVPFSERYQAGLKFLENDVWVNTKNEIGCFIGSHDKRHTEV